MHSYLAIESVKPVQKLAVESLCLAEHLELTVVVFGKYCAKKVEIICRRSVKHTLCGNSQ